MLVVVAVVVVAEWEERARWWWRVCVCGDWGEGRCGIWLLCGSVGGFG